MADVGTHHTEGTEALFAMRREPLGPHRGGRRRGLLYELPCVLDVGPLAQPLADRQADHVLLTQGAMGKVHSAGRIHPIEQVPIQPVQCSPVRDSTGVVAETHEPKVYRGYQLEIRTFFDQPG